MRADVIELAHVATIIPSYLHPGAFHAVSESCAWRSPFSSEERAYHMVETHQQAMKARRRKR